MANHINFVVIPSVLNNATNYSAPDQLVMARQLKVSPRHVDEEEAVPEGKAVF